ncbi:MAG: Lrp/AsnC family transcriptional regulator [Rhodanobacteraceae bacterium]|nr:Lrp/AsnC family transcriptional regulator [Rhodanobacteraceae bacterium]
MTELDRIDRSLLALLQRDARHTNAELAEQVALSPSACLRRLQRLERAGIIRGYRAVLDPAAVGRGLTAFVRVQLERHDAEHVERFAALVAGWDAVVACYTLTGDMDYLLHVAVADLDHFNRFIMGELLKHGGVRDVNTSFVLGTVKPDQGLPLA